MDIPETIRDGGEHIGMMEPMLLERDSPKFPSGLPDKALDLATKATAFESGLPRGVAAELAALVRVVNCYYSNLIEGHDTHPVSIERAMAGDSSAEPEKRSLQLEATAHVAVQKWIEEGGLGGEAVSADSLLEIHRRFCDELPDELLWVDNPDTGERLPVVPGKTRGHDLAVGRHIPVSPGAVPRFLARYGEVYGKLGKADRILAAAAAHHRLVWIHPFLDGNGRVARLATQAMLMDALGVGGLWSVARGLARNVDAYKGKLAACDLPRRNDYDGRGPLGYESLADFTEFFLDTCIDQVDFMRGLMEPRKLHARVLAWARAEPSLPKRSEVVLKAVLNLGEVERGEIPGMLGVTERQARRVTADLAKAGVLKSDSDRAPLRLAFTARLAEHWMPGLFPAE